MSSRLIVRNLPKHLTEKRLKSHFEQQGAVTDVRIAKTKDGRTRRFGFVGFKTADQAKKAKSHFNRTYIDTSCMDIEMAVRAGDSGLARPWSRYSEGSSRQQAEAFKHPEQKQAAKQKQRGNGGFGKAGLLQDEKRPKKRPTKSVTLDLGDNSTETAKLLKQVYTDDPKFAEFVQAFAPRNKTTVRHRPATPPLPRAAGFQLSPCSCARQTRG